jgi:hypothetical protein
LVTEQFTEGLEQSDKHRKAMSLYASAQVTVKCPGSLLRPYVARTPGVGTPGTDPNSCHARHDRSTRAVTGWRERAGPSSSATPTKEA